jgi:hypothetical protein
LAISVFIKAVVVIEHKNVLGSRLLKSRLHIFSPKTLQSTAPIGFVDVGEAYIKGSADGPTRITADVTIDQISLDTALRLVYHIVESNWRLPVTALGTALVQAEVTKQTVDPLMIIYMRCPESLRITIGSSIAVFETSPSQNCQYSYEWSLYGAHYLNNSLPVLDRKYLFQSL